jgi:hypothetical protein
LPEEKSVTCTTEGDSESFKVSFTRVAKLLPKTPHPSEKQYFVPLKISGMTEAFSEGTRTEEDSEESEEGRRGRETERHIPILAQ